MLADVLGVDHDRLTLQPTVDTTTTTVALDQSDDNASTSDSLVVTSTRKNPDEISTRSRTPLIDERLVDFVLQRIGSDVTRPTTWNDRPFSRCVNFCCCAA